MGAVLHGPGEGERLEVGPSEVVIKATSEDTGGGMYLAEGRTPELIESLSKRHDVQLA